VAQQATSDRLAHAGVPAERITLLGNRVVHLPAVFGILQQPPAVAAQLPAPGFTT
jgi:hypothetical protein